MFRKKESGYSLIEALVVIAIIGLIAVVGVPNFVSMYRTSKMKTSVRQFTTDLRWCRTRAATRNARTLVTFATGEGKNTYRIYDGTRQSDGTYSWAMVPDRGRSQRTLDPNVFFDSTGFADDVDLSAVNAADAGLPDIVFGENGSVVNIPSAVADRKATLRTVLTIPKQTYDVVFGISGQVKAQ